MLARVRPVIPEDGSRQPIVVTVDADDDTRVLVNRDGRLLSFDCDCAFPSVFYPGTGQLLHG